VGVFASLAPGARETAARPAVRGRPPGAPRAATHGPSLAGTLALAAPSPLSPRRSAAYFAVPVFRSAAREDHDDHEARAPSAELPPEVAGSAVDQGGGAPLDPATGVEMSRRFGADLTGVRLHADAAADAACGAINAEAFTRGAHIFFRAGRYAPTSSAGRELLAHELTHVVQQAGGPAAPAPPADGAVRQTAAVISSPSDAAEVEARQLGAEVAAGRDVQVRSSAPRHAHRVPSYIVSATFLGQNVDGGVNPVMRTKLRAAETAIQASFNALPTAQQVDFATGAPTTSYIAWSGVTEVGGWRASTTSRHGSGSAVDINYHNNPYIATGTVASPGGENGPGAVAGIDDARSRAIEVYERAFTFIVNDGFDLAGMPHSDVRPRQTGETTAAMHRRFQQTSDALRDYLRLAFNAGSPAPNNTVNRVPVANVETAPEATLLAQIPLTERKDETTAVADLDRFMRGPRQPWGIIVFNP